MKILTARKFVYRLAPERHPERWRKQRRNWDYIQEVYLSPEKRRHNVILLQQAKTTLKTPGTTVHLRQNTHFLEKRFCFWQEGNQRVRNRFSA
ncbi:hypothetical protein [Serratia fonticola]|uniref:hypothetical protein n=1 Tax=Serratia fonticola TaxID=47917 RepID=UPI00301E156B